jgi:hypothetical protein
MPIKNYTSNVGVGQSLGEIQDALARGGATKIMIDYADGIPVALSFALSTPEGPLGFQLPANMPGVARAFVKQKVKADADQVKRTAWRNIRDWVLAQMAFIEAGNVDMTEVFLPYLTNGRGRTLYQIYQSGQLMLPERSDT